MEDLVGTRRWLAFSACVLVALTSTGAHMLLPRGLEGQFEEAYRSAFTAGVARVFLVAALLAAACAVLTWAAVPRRAASPIREPA